MTPKLELFHCHCKYVNVNTAKLSLRDVSLVLFQQDKSHNHTGWILNQSALLRPAFIAHSTAAQSRPFPACMIKIMHNQP